MITQLRIKNLIVVEEAFLEFGKGLNVLTGSTGSGKSVLLAALSLLAGERAKSDWIGPAGDHAFVEALLEVDGPLLERLRNQGLQAEEGQIVLRREIRPDGRGQAAVEGRLASVGMLRELGALLFERQDQHEQLRLLDPVHQGELLDDFAGHGSLLDDYRSALDTHRRLLDEEASFRERIEGLCGEEEFLRFQLEEIDGLGPSPDEKEQLELRERRLRMASKIQDRLRESLHLLEDGESPIMDSLLGLDKSLQRLSSLEEREADTVVDPMILELRNLAEELRGRSQSLAAEADEAGDVSRRLGLLHTLERKHGKPLAEILAWAEKQRESLAELEEGERGLEAFASRIEKSGENLSLAAGKLSNSRAKAAKKLGREWQSRLALLGMETAKLRLEVSPREDEDGWIRIEGRHFRAGFRGMDRVRVLVRTNPDHEEGTLRDIPSGGELSRIALACRMIPGLRGGPPVLLLDEVDAGLGADLAPTLAARLKELSRERQVLLVTHQPALAAAGDQQFGVRKTHEKGGTRVEVRRLESDERLDEIVRMLGGGESGEVRQHARSLLARAVASS